MAPPTDGGGAAYHDGETEERYVYSMGDTAGSELDAAFGAVNDCDVDGDGDGDGDATETLNDSITFGEILQRAASSKNISPPNNNNNNSNSTCMNNDDSLSRTLDEEELLAHTGAAAAAAEINDTSLSLLSHSQNDDSNSNNKQQPTSKTNSSRTSTCTPTTRQRQRRVRSPGPNERVYARHYQRGVQNRIQEHRRRHPHDLPVYGEMNEGDQRQEQERVLRLLQRLQIASNSGTSAAGNTDLLLLSQEKVLKHADDSLATYGTSTDHDTSTSMLLLTPPGGPPGSQQQQPLFSPVALPHAGASDAGGAGAGAVAAAAGGAEMQDNNDNNKQSNQHDDDDDDDAPFPEADCDDNDDNNNNNQSSSSFDSTQSVEQTRAAAAPAYYDSPASVSSATALRKKRLATTSGKRGADAARLRLLNDDDDYNDQDEPSLLRSIGRLSLHDNDGNVFTASQSPISQHLTHSPLRQPMDEDMSSSCCSDDDNDDGNRKMASTKRRGPNISFGADDSSMEDAHRSDSDGDGDDSSTAAAKNNDNKQSSSRRFDNDTLVETSMLENKQVRWDFDGKLAKEAPTDVRLAPGQIFQYPKLPVQTKKRRGGIPTQTFPDPFAYYDDNAKFQRRLNRLYQWILQRDQSTVASPSSPSLSSSSACAVLNIELEQIVDVVLKLALEYPGDDEDDDESDQLDKDETPSALRGNALIVARAKEDLEILSQAFREGSACAVLNHASLPLKDRKSTTTAAKAAKFDVVLTTYDALKAPDATLRINSQGHVVHRKETCQDGWYTSKSSSSASQSVSAAASTWDNDDGGDDDDDGGDSAAGDDSNTKNALTNATTTNKQLSVLHRLVWHRVVFIDMLGRKCFLAKSGTARVAAATALGARSRLAFFAQDEDAKEKVKGFKALKQSDKTALPSLTAVLHLPTVDGEATGLRQNIVDFLDKKKAQRH